MNAADIEAGKKHLADYLENFYRVKREKLSGHPATPVAIDPQKVAAEARACMDMERAKGRVISATEAVRRVLQKRGSQ